MDTSPILSYAFTLILRYMPCVKKRIVFDWRTLSVLSLQVRCVGGRGGGGGGVGVSRIECPETSLTPPPLRKTLTSIGRIDFQSVDQSINECCRCGLRQQKKKPRGTTGISGNPPHPPPKNKEEQKTTNRWIRAATNPLDTCFLISSLFPHLNCLTKTGRVIFIPFLY